MFYAKIHIRLKKGLLDPQGKTIGSSLKSLGYKGISEVKVGKLIEVKLAAKDKKEASKKIEEICRKLLANPVIELFEYELEEAT